MPTQKDPTTFGYQNFYSTTLTGDITSGTLTIGLATVPSPTSGILIIEPDSTSAREVVFYTSKGASTVTCPSDGRGWSGSTASPHLTGSAVIMASVDEYFKGLADGTLSNDPIRPILIQNHIVSGGVVAQSSGLIGTFSNIVFYINGQRYSGTSIANKTYTASKDTYVDITATSGGGVSVTYTEVANGATSGFTLAAGYVRVAKVITSGAAITSVQQSGFDYLGQRIYYTSPLAPTQPALFWEEIGRVTAVGAAATLDITVPVRKYLIVRGLVLPTGSQSSVQVRFNGDSANNYHYRTSTNGGADATGIIAGIPVDVGVIASDPLILEMEGFNIAAQEKVFHGHAISRGTAGANPPNRREAIGKWTNTTNAITAVQLWISDTTFAAGSELVVLGHD